MKVSAEDTDGKSIERAVRRARSTCCTKVSKIKLNSASQSSMWGNYGASLAIDGKTDGHFTRSKSCTHTSNEAGKKSWWKANIPKGYIITSIDVYNRIDGSMSRLSNTLIDIDDKTVAQIGNTDGESKLSFELSPIRITKDTEIKIQHKDSGKFLTLCEVELNGCTLPGVS